MGNAGFMPMIPDPGGPKDPRSRDRCGNPEGASKLGQHLPQVMEAFSGLAQACVAEGALSTKAKELIPVGIAVVVRCNT